MAGTHQQTHGPEKGKARKSGEKGREGGAISSDWSPAQVQKLLGGLDYPVQKQQLLDKAKSEGADRNIMNIIGKLPDQEYGSPVAVSRELGKLK